MKKLVLIPFLFLFFSNPLASFAQVCGGTFTDPPGATVNYLNNSDYTVTICPTNPGEKVTVAFTSFGIEVTWDALYVFDGNTINSPQIASANPAGNVPGGLAGGFWGTANPGPFTSTDATGCLTFRFRSDNSQTGIGWVANITCALPPTCPSPTQLTTTNVTTNSVTLGWVSTASNWDVIALPCGSAAPSAATQGTNTSANPFTFTGLLLPSMCYDFYVRSRCLSTDIGPWSNARSATTAQLPPACGGFYTDTGGTAGNYLNDADITTIICPNNTGDVVTVTFTAFNTEATYDALYVFDGNSTSSTQIASANAAINVPGGLAGGFWGTTIPGPFTSTADNGCLTFRFRSDDTAVRTGWIANVVCNPPPSCPKPTNLIAVGSTINSVSLSWTNNSSATSFEVVALPCSTSPTATTTGTITSSNPFTLSGLDSSTCYNLFVRARCLGGADLSVWSNPIAITTLTIPPVCGGSYKDNGGINAPYLPNSDSTVTICPAIAGQAVTVTFNAFDVQANFDALYVFDGNSIASPQISGNNPAASVPGGLANGFWGTVIPGPFTSTDPSGCLTFRFRSDATINSAGWSASVSCGPSEDSIVLISFVDQNSNGIKDSNESLYSHGSFVYQQNNAGSFTNAYSPSGRYVLTDTNPVNTYDFSYQVQPEFAAYYSSGTITFNDVAIAAGSGTTALYFPVTLIQTYNDVTVSITPISPPRPALTYINKVIYKNIGFSTASGTIAFTKPTAVAITNVSQTGTLTNTSGFTYAYTNLLPGETRIINVTMSVPSSPTVALNTLLTASATISAPNNDINLANNSSSLSQIVVNSFDPNNKIESRGDKIPINQFSQSDYFFYTIRFQNNGTANAIDVRIRDVLSAKIDESTLRMVSASHNYTMDRIDNAVVWNFDNIQLVPSTVSPEMSSGYINFKVKLKPGFAAGDIVSNNASIFFDSNPAITTNTFNTKFTAVLHTLSYELGSFRMYPNPANGHVTFSMENANEKIAAVSFTDILGKTVKSIKNSTSNEMEVDVSELSAGIYLVEITTENNLKATRKLVIN